MPQLTDVNSYVVRGMDRHLIVDPGGSGSTCSSAMREALRILHVDLKSVDIFLTHPHGDHMRLARELAGPGSKVFMGASDVAWLRE